MAKDAGRFYQKRPKRRWIGLALAAGWIIWGFGYETVWQRWALHIEGTVISSRDVPASGAPRYATYYVIKGSDGVEQSYVAGATDASLQRSLPVGAHINKQWGQLGYDLNGKWVKFPIIFYDVFLAVAALLAFLAARAWWGER